jgi:uncharacterized protein (TIGR01244 family)
LADPTTTGFGLLPGRGVLPAKAYCASGMPMAIEALNTFVCQGRSGLEIKRINDQVSVSGQISAADVIEIKQAGFVTIVNNRPDGEEDDQPSNAEIEAAAKGAGLAFVFIPMGREGVNEEMIARTRETLDDSEGPVFCYCRTGTRSTTLWALAQAGRRPAEEIIASAAKAGYNISHLAGHLG